MEEQDIINKKEQEINQEYDKFKQIAELLNILGSMALKQKNIPIEISEENNLVIIELINNKFYLIKNILENSYG